MAHPASASIGFDFPALAVAADQNVTIGAASVQSTALGANTRIARVVATVACWIEFGANPTATTSSVYLPANLVEYFVVSPSSKIAVIQAATGGTLNIAEMA